jgi:hypothetical protein
MELVISPRPWIPKLGTLAQQEVEIELSTIRESLLDLHATQAIELIEQTREHVPTTRAFEIYCHLHRVSGHEAIALRTRVLARLGERLQKRDTARVSADAAVAQEWDSPWSWLLWLRRRLQGRQNLELRRWIELHSGRTETKLLELHVGGALRLIRLLKPESSYAEVVQLYTDSMGVPASLSRAIYFMTLSRLEEPAAAPAVAPVIEPATATERRQEKTLRMVAGKLRRQDA